MTNLFYIIIETFIHWNLYFWYFYHSAFSAKLHLNVISRILNITTMCQTVHRDHKTRFNAVIWYCVNYDLYRRFVWKIILKRIYENISWSIKWHYLQLITGEKKPNEPYFLFFTRNWPLFQIIKEADFSFHFTYLCTF